MSLNPAHSHRRALSPPAITRFHLRTASASEAVFSPPFIPPRTEGARYSRRPPTPVTYEPTTPPGPERPAPPRISAPVFSRTPETVRPAPRGKQPAEPPAAPYLRQLPGALPPATRPLELTAGQAPAEEVLDLTEEVAPSELELTEAMAFEEPDELELVDEVSGSSELPWEYEAMTAPEYSAPSIHDPEHDSWPVTVPPGDAIPAFGSPDDVEDLELALDDVVEERSATEAAGEDLPFIDEADAAGGDFPLDAFIVPRGVDHVPVGYAAEIGGTVADHLEDLARRIREQGIETIGHVSGADELSVVLGALVTGYLARHG